ncbi:flavin reductase [Aureimonas ureilytica]|uniref:Flavin reductase n=1 Tax=Aureimonas ureilytica TaxID=401562 RepID=A0A175RB05_9HYPH|nr:flavin reductase family protein [Aureimonas ureilytica]KTQ97021.1 flavin reductase [Aureimonas ureilytica]
MNQQSKMSDAFRTAFRHHPAGVAVVTADPGDCPVALTISSLISVSAAPPVIAFSLSARSNSTEPMLRAETMVVHFLRYADLDLAQLGASSGAERFGGAAPWERLPTGEPRYTGVGTWFRVRKLGLLPVEGATLVAAELLEGEVGSDGDASDIDALVYQDRRWHRLQKGVDASAHLCDLSHFL